MKKKSLRKLNLAFETILDLSKPTAAIGFDRVGSASPDEDTCYWGCSFTCPDAGTKPQA